MARRIVITGGTGQVGTILARAFVNAGDDVVVVSRHQKTTEWRTVIWDGVSLGAWAREFDGADIVVNLAGRSVNCRYTAENRQAIMESRTKSTRVVGQAISSAKEKPKLWLQASTATIYAHRFDADNDEKAGIIGGSEPDAPTSWRFSIDVARAWENEIETAEVGSTRKVALRTSMVMSPDTGGIFDTMMGLVRLGLGGKSGDGRQFVSWIHDDDFVRAIEWLISHDEMSGVVNLASPQPIPNAEFMRAIRRAANISIGLPAAKWMLEIGALFMATETELVLKSRRVVPKRLLDAGFSFQFPHWAEAAHNLVTRWNERR